MRLFPFARSRERSFASAARPATRRRGAQARLLLEALEERRVPTLFVVNSLLDGAPAADGQLTLREAVTAANTNAPSGDAPAGTFPLDTIEFAPSLAFGTIKLQSAQGGLVLGGGGDIAIVGPVAGNGQGLVISGENAVRVFDITEPAGAVLLDSLTIERGNADLGAGLRNAGPLTTLSHVQVEQNAATGVGGGIQNTFAGTLVLSHSTVSNNTSVNSEGGIGNELGGKLTVTLSRIVGNSAGFNGGGLLNLGTATIGASTIAGNIAAAGDGGGIDNISASLTISRSLIDGNSAGGLGGGIHDAGSGANTGTHLDNSTVSDNTGEGGGIMSENNTTLRDCTVARNADATNNANGAGGIAKHGGVLDLTNTICSLNAAGSASEDPNVKESLLDADILNFIGGDPRLSPLGDHGGPTLTMAPLAGSPVIDSGDTIDATGSLDQRGARRIIDGDHDGLRFVDVGAVEFSTGPINPIVTGADQGGSPEVKVIGGIHGALRYDFLAYASGFTGGVRVAVGDVTDDGVDDYVTGPGPGGGPQVNVYSGANGALVKSFMAFSPSFTGGVFVAAGDINNDDFADVIVGEDAGGTPTVSVFDGKSLAQGTKLVLASFLAFDAAFTGGVRVAVGDVNHDFLTDVIAGKGPGMAPRVKVFSGNGLSSASQTVLFNLLAYAPSFTGGVYVASADTNGDGHADIITGAGAGGGPAVNVFSGADGSVLASFFAYSPAFGGGVRVSATDLNGDGFADIITGRGPGGEPTVKVFDGPTQQALDRFDAYDLTFAGGVFVGGG